MSRQVSRGSAGEYQADERAGVTGLSWRVLKMMASSSCLYLLPFYPADSKGIKIKKTTV